MDIDYIDFFKNLFLLAFGVCAGLVVAFRIVWPKVEALIFKTKMLDKQHLEASGKSSLRAGSYERLLLFVNRIEPRNLIARHYQDHLTVAQLHQLVVQEVESEFQYNFTQQLYVSTDAWAAVRVLKENTVGMLDSVAKAKATDTVANYTEGVLRFLVELSPNPYDTTVLILKKEAGL
ncbi:DUF7935 family protein [Sphingobacterium sp. SYP-B4668]|uniref:DUF7935 family protein n=1 Tax=Sphingobacterium sp. SYP-B4668 TaxID=2996035 RepID=UPI0022DDE45F|nr:hypothetical protein [Sphingobacterium sp. SYP-B4668]